MIAPEHPMEKPIRVSSMLVLVGMLIELFTLTWAHPVAFIVFLVLGGIFIVSGVAFYLVMLLKVEQFYEVQE